MFDLKQLFAVTLTGEAYSRICLSPLANGNGWKETTKSIRIPAPNIHRFMQEYDKISATYRNLYPKNKMNV